MIRTQIYITAKERSALSDLAHVTGKSQSELIREAIDYFCKMQSQETRIASLSSARGIWKARDDLPDLDALRKEYDREPKYYKDKHSRKKTKKK